MALQTTSFNGNSKGNMDFFGALKDSAINVGSCALIGGTTGALGGKLACLKPYKPTQSALEFQYSDIFQKAVLSETNPSHIKNAGDDFVKLVDKGRLCTQNINELSNNLLQARTIRQTLEKMDDSAIMNESFQNTIKEFIKNNGIELSKENISKEAITENLENINQKLVNKIQENAKPIEESKSEFVNKIAAAKNSQIDEIAQNGAKHLRNKSIIGAAIAIGITGALVLNLLKTYGLIGKKRPKAQISSPPNQNNPSGGQNPQTVVN